MKPSYQVLHVLVLATWFGLSLTARAADSGTVRVALLSGLPPYNKDNATLDCVIRNTSGESPDPANGPAASTSSKVKVKMISKTATRRVGEKTGDSDTSATDDTCEFTVAAGHSVTRTYGVGQGAGTNLSGCSAAAKYPSAIRFEVRDTDDTTSLTPPHGVITATCYFFFPSYREPGITAHHVFFGQAF